MNVKQLKELINKFPDDAEVAIELSSNGTEAVITDIKISYSSKDLTVDSSNPANADQIYIYESEPNDSREFDDQVRLGLPEEFTDLCFDNKVSPETVLHGFIADLCEIHNTIDNPRADKLSSNGSDERMLANQYFERVGYNYS
ncbi:MAG: hypothetical protein Q8N30_03950 [Methylococcales bacterium]|nr:hypothetical protein [Methylococcales bacterium]